MKRKPIVIGSLIFVFTVVTIYISSLIFNDFRQSVIAGLLVGVLAILFEIRLAIELSSEKAVNSTKEFSQRLVESLDIKQTYTANEWMREILNRLFDLRKVAEQQVHDLARFQKIIAQALDDAKKEVGTSFSLPTGDDELERIIRLNDTVSNAKEYVYAVTFDANDYLNKFWAKVFGEEYIKSNLAAAKRGVLIKRIFIVEKKIMDNKQLDNADKEKRNNLMSLIKALKRAKNNMEIYLAAVEDLPESLKTSNTSLLVSDDYVGSESNGLSNGEKVFGYVSYGDLQGVIEPLKDRFDKLKRYAKKM